MTYHPLTQSGKHDGKLAARRRSNNVPGKTDASEIAMQALRRVMVDSDSSYVVDIHA
jgi:hypothetical protein